MFFYKDYFYSGRKRYISVLYLLFLLNYRSIYNDRFINKNGKENFICIE